MMKMHRTLIGIGLLCGFALSSLFAQKPVAPVASGIKGTTSFSTTELTQLVNAGVLGSQPTKLPSQNGTYGIIFQDYKAYNLYKDRILDHLDDFIEAASLNLNSSNEAIVNEIMKACYEYIDTQERKNKESKVDESPYFGNYAYYYGMFDQIMRNKMKGVNWANFITDHAVNQAGSQFLKETVLYAGQQQCASYCSQSFFQFGWGTEGSLGAYIVASRLAYLFSYDNVAKQDNPIYKALYDTYVARKTNAEFANYKSLSKYHGSQLSFGIYQLPFGKLASTFVDSEKLKTYATLLWDTKCDCPSAASFLNAVEAQKTFFTIP